MDNEYTTHHMSFISMWLGVLMGATLMIAVFMALYNARAGPFSYCAIETNICKASEYFNDPGKAVANGSDPKDILFVNDKGEMEYKRVPKDDCTPGENQDIYIKNPQFCEFTGEFGARAQGKQLQTGSDIYEISGGETVMAPANCFPQGSQDFDDGFPLIKWEQS